MKLKLGEEGRRLVAVFAISFVLASQIVWAQSRSFGTWTAAAV